MALATPGESAVTRFIRKYYAPILLTKEVKQLVIAAFGGLFIAATVGIQRISLGLGEYRKYCCECCRCPDLTSAP